MIALKILFVGSEKGRNRIAREKALTPRALDK
jgi:hypothetical protein